MTSFYDIIGRQSHRRLDPPTAFFFLVATMSSNDRSQDSWQVAQCVGGCGAWTDGSQFCRKTYCDNPGGTFEPVMDPETQTVVVRRHEGMLYPAECNDCPEPLTQDALGWVRVSAGGVEYRVNALVGHALRVQLDVM